MAEWADQWRSEGKKNIWGALPIVEEMQSEGGAAGALARRSAGRCFRHHVHSLAGPAADDPQHVQDRRRTDPGHVMHVTARTLATHALSIFGDHSDVMACRSTGCAMLAPTPCRKSPTWPSSPRSRRSNRASPSCISSMASARRTKSARSSRSATRPSARCSTRNT